MLHMSLSIQFVKKRSAIWYRADSMRCTMVTVQTNALQTRVAQPSIILDLTDHYVNGHDSASPCYVHDGTVCRQTSIQPVHDSARGCQCLSITTVRTLIRRGATAHISELAGDCGRTPAAALFYSPPLDDDLCTCRHAGHGPVSVIWQAPLAPHRRHGRTRPLACRSGLS